MNLLLWTANVTEKDYPLLRRLRETGYDGVEVPVFEGNAAQYRALRQVLANLGLGATAVTVMSADANPISPDAATRRAAVDRLRWVIDRCAEFGAEVLCGPLHSALGVFSGVGPTSEEHERSLEIFQEVGAHAAAAGVDLAVEYLNRFENYFLTTAAQACAWTRAIDRPACGLMWDSFHAHIEEKAVRPAIAAMKPHLRHVHISENDRGTPGTGSVRWEETFAALHAAGYDRWLVIEAFGRTLPEVAAATRVWRDLFEDGDELCRDGLAFIRRSWAEISGD